MTARTGTGSNSMDASNSWKAGTMHYAARMPATTKKRELCSKDARNNRDTSNNRGDVSYAVTPWDAPATEKTAVRTTNTTMATSVTPATAAGYFVWVTCGGGGRWGRLATQTQHHSQAINVRLRRKFFFPFCGTSLVHSVPYQLTERIMGFTEAQKYFTYYFFSW